MATSSPTQAVQLPPTIGPRGWTLAAVAGWVDAAGFVTLGGLFVANMSGNTVAFGASLGRGGWRTGWPHLLAVPVFMVGIFLGTLWLSRPGRRQPERWLFLVEAALLAGLAMLLHFNLFPSYDSLRFWLAASLALLAMSLQNATMRKVGSLTVHTTYMTGMLNLCAVQSAQAWLWWRGQTRGRNALRHQRAWMVLGRQRNALDALRAGGLWLIYAFGAVLASIGLLQLGSVSLVVPVAALLGLACWPVSREEG